jgi:aspartate/glutamate racemase
MGRHGIEVVVPEPDDRETVHRIIYEELCRGVFRDDSRAAYVPRPRSTFEAPSTPRCGDLWVDGVRLGPWG